jgi:glutathione S-transferase
MKLYYAPGACSLSPHIVAEEAGIKLDLERVDLKTHKTENGEDFYAVNPKGYVPAMKLDDGTMLTEGVAIVQYLADQKPASNLAPANGTMARYHLQEWLTFINSEIHKSFSPLFGANTPDEAKADARQKIAKRFAYVEKAMTGPFLMGEHFNAADAYFFVMLLWARNMKIEPGAKIDEYFKRVIARPAVQAALRAEGLHKHT